MKLIMTVAALAGLCVGSAAAQTATDPKTPAVATPNAVNPAAPVAGANSFTEAQAKQRIENSGFTDVSPLLQADDGIWRGTAMRAGQKVKVSLDFQGNVVAQ